MLDFHSGQLSWFVSEGGPLSHKMDLERLAAENLRVKIYAGLSEMIFPGAIAGELVDFLTRF